jgi:hypothetical protein
MGRDVDESRPWHRREHPVTRRIAPAENLRLILVILAENPRNDLGFNLCPPKVRV